jgi:hypothetical protein
MDYHSVGAVKRKEMPSISGSFTSAAVVKGVINSNLSAQS